MKQVPTGMVLLKSQRVFASSRRSGLGPHPTVLAAIGEPVDGLLGDPALDRVVIDPGLRRRGARDDDERTYGRHLTVVRGALVISGGMVEPRVYDVG